MAFRIGIAGCGVAGLAAGVMLARAGHQVVVHEQAVTLGPVGAGVLLQPSGQRVLKEMGLLEKVVEYAEAVERLVAVTHKRRGLVDLAYEEGTRAYGVRRGVLFTVLHEAAVAAGVRVVTGQKVERYERGAGGVWFLTAGGERVGPYDFVLGADGGAVLFAGE